MTATLLIAAMSLLVCLTNGLGDTDTITWGGDNTRSGYQTNHNMDPAIVGSDDFAQIFKTALPGTYNGYAEQIFSQPLVYTPSDGTQYVYFATTQNNVYKLDAKTGEILASRNLAIPFLTADLDGCVDINPCIGVTATGVIDPDTDTLYLTVKTYEDQDGGTTAQGRPAGRYYFHALSVDDLTERDNFPVNLEGIAARNNPSRTFNGGIHHQRPGLLHSGQYIYAGFASHCVQYNFTGWIIGWDKTTGEIVERWATEGDGVPNTTPGGGVWMSGGGLASDDSGSMFFGTGNGYASQLSTIPVDGRDPPTSMEEAAVHMTINDDGSLTVVDFFMPYEKQALDGADKDLGTSPLELLPSEFSCGDITRMGVITGKSGKTYFLNIDDLGGYRTNNDGDNVIQVYQNENSVYAGAGVYPLEGGYIYINVIQYPTHVFKFQCDNGVPSFTKVADSPENNAYILGVSHGTVTSLNGTAGTGLLWTTDVQGNNLRIYNAVPDGDTLTEIKSFSVPGTTKFTRAVFGDGRVYMGTTLGYVYGFGAPVNQPLNCTTSGSFGTVDITADAKTITVTCKAVIATTVKTVSVNSTDFNVSSVPALPDTLAVGETITFDASFKPSAVGLRSGNIIVATTNDETGYASQTSVRLTGTGASSGPLLSVSPSLMTFSNVVVDSSSAGTTDPFVISNEGNSTLTISSIKFSQTSATGPFEEGTSAGNGTQIGVFTLSGLPSTIAAGGGKTVQVTFDPTTGGNYTLYVVVSSDGGDDTITISGNAGPAPTCLVEFQTPDGTGWVEYVQNSNFTFGNVTENNTLKLKMRVTNNGTSDAVPLSITVSKPPFGVSGIIAAVNQVDLAEGTILNAGESATATMYCSVPKEQWNTDPYWGAANWTMNTNDPHWDKQYMQFSCLAVSEQAPPLQSNGLGVYRYVGCYKDNNPDRQLPTQMYGNDNNTNAMCIAACADAGYAYCGTEYQRECWAGSSIPNLQVSESDCNYACSGDVNQYCGGNGAGDDAGGSFISVFAKEGANTNSSDGGGGSSSSGPVVNPGDYGYVSLGCYKEPSTTRALPNALTANQTVENCLAAAAADKYVYAGLEYGGECWAGNTLDSGSNVTTLSSCNMVCNSNSSEYCGGSSLLNLYRSNSTSTTTPTSSSVSSTPSATGGPTTNAGVNGYKFLGCYHEPSDSRAFSQQLTANETVADCVAAASAAGYSYAGVEYGGECWAGNSISADATKEATSACSMTCNDNSTEYCGGSLLLDVYYENSTSTSTSAGGKGSSSTGTTSAVVSNATLSANPNATSSSPTSTSTSASGPKATVGDWVYKGCYTEGSSSRALVSSAQTNNEMTYEECASFCSSYAYFGVEYGDQCYCGNYLTTGSTKTSESDCSTLCSGDTTEYCGAGNRLNVYQQNDKKSGPPAAKDAIGKYVYYGCYSEATNDRALSGSSTANTNMTEEYCASFCSGYSMFGLEYGSECYCSNSLSTGSEKLDESKCSMGCAGEADELCGAGSILTVFSLSSNSTISSSVSASSSSVPISSASSSSTSTSSSLSVLESPSTSATSAPTFSSASSSESSLSLTASKPSSLAASSSTATSATSTETSAAAAKNGLVNTDSNSTSSSSSSSFGSPNSPTLNSTSVTSAPATSASTSSSASQSAVANSTSLVLSTPSSSLSSVSVTSTTPLSSIESFSPSSSVTSSPISSTSSATVSPSSNPSPWVTPTASTSTSATSLTTTSSTPVPTPISSTVTPSNVSFATSSTSTSASASVSPVIAMGNINFTYYNCLAEPSSGYLLDNLLKLNTTNMTVQYCLSKCWEYTYAGLESGKQCWCGSALNLTASANSTTGITKKGECDDSCTGNHSEYCGADKRLLVYKLTELL